MKIGDGQETVHFIQRYSYSVARLWCRGECVEHIVYYNSLDPRFLLTDCNGYSSCVLPLEQLVAVYTQHNLAFKNVRCSTAECQKTQGLETLAKITWMKCAFTLYTIPYSHRRGEKVNDTWRYTFGTHIHTMYIELLF